MIRSVLIRILFKLLKPLKPFCKREKIEDLHLMTKNAESDVIFGWQNHQTWRPISWQHLFMQTKALAETLFTHEEAGFSPVTDDKRQALLYIHGQNRISTRIRFCIFQSGKKIWSLDKLSLTIFLTHLILFAHPN